MAFNNLYFYKIAYKNYFVYDYKQDEIVEIVNFVKLNSDKKFLYCNTFEWDKTQKVFNTYSDINNIMFLYNSRHLNSKDINFIYNYKKHLSEFDYVISPKISSIVLPDNCYEIPLKNRGFRIFKIFETSKNLYCYKVAKNYSLFFGNVFLNNSYIDDDSIKIGNFGGLFIPCIRLKDSGKYQIEIIFEKNIEPSTLYCAIDKNNFSHKMYNFTDIFANNISTHNNKVCFFIDENFKYFDIKIENNSNKNIVIKDILLTKIEKDKSIDKIDIFKKLEININDEKVKEDWLKYSL